MTWKAYAKVRENDWRQYHRDDRPRRRRKPRRRSNRFLERVALVVCLVVLVPFPVSAGVLYIWNFSDTGNNVFDWNVGGSATLDNYLTADIPTGTTNLNGFTSMNYQVFSSTGTTTIHGGELTPPFQGYLTGGFVEVDMNVNNGQYVSSLDYFPGGSVSGTNFMATIGTTPLNVQMSVNYHNATFFNSGAATTTSLAFR